MSEPRRCWVVWSWTHIRGTSDTEDGAWRDVWSEEGLQGYDYAAWKANRCLAGWTCVEMVEVTRGEA